MLDKTAKNAIKDISHKASIIIASANDDGGFVRRPRPQGANGLPLYSGTGSGKPFALMTATNFTSLAAKRGVFGTYEKRFFGHFSVSYPTEHGFFINGSYVHALTLTVKQCDRLSPMIDDIL